MGEDGGEAESASPPSLPKAALLFPPLQGTFLKGGRHLRNGELSLIQTRKVNL